MPSLTHQERDAIEKAVRAMRPECRTVLQGLLDRLSPIAAGDNDRPEAIDSRLAALERLVAMEQELERDCPDQDNAPKQDTTPGEGSVPPEWMSRPYWVDPPSGWAYGFPRLYDPAKDGNMTEWMVRHGYPKNLADTGLPCTFTATE